MHSLKRNSDGFSLVELVIVVVVLAVIGFIGYLAFHHKTTTTSNSTSGSSTGSSSTTGSLSPPKIPTNQAYLGAFVNPKAVTISIKQAGSAIPGSNTTPQLPAFRQLIGKPVGILQFYMPFKDALPTSTLNDIETAGSIPLISWGCTSLSSISGGQYDSYITSYASSLKSFGKPVFLRWYWEMNQLNKDGSQPAGASCGGYNNGPAFISAWQHIYTIFQSVGASNVAFVWCPGYSGGNFNTYYPGDAYVNWIGIDRYERTQNGGPLLDFNGMFSSYDQEWASHNKPLMIAETAAMGSSDQSGYLSSVLSEAPSNPNIKAFVYFDATGPAGDWQFEGAGVTAYQQLASSSYFIN